MRKLNIFAIFGAISSAFVFSWAASSSAVPDKLSSVARVYDDAGHGSGVWIAPNVVLTARHVINDAEGEIRVSDETGGVYHVKSIEYSQAGNDIVRLTLDKPAPVAFAAVDCSMPSLLTQLEVMGYPLDLMSQVRYVRVSGFGSIEDTGVDGVDPGMPVMWVDGTVIPGDSGGPVFSKKGVVGLMDGIMRNSPNVNGSSGLAFIVPLAKEPLVCGATKEV